MAIAVLSVFVAALAAPVLHRLVRERTGWLLAILPAGLAAYFARFSAQIADGHVVSVSYSWVLTLDVSFSFYLDGLSLLFALLITGIGALVLVYANGYLNGHVDLGRFYALLLMFMGAILGLVLADNVITLFVFWELTSISSYLLIGFDHERTESRAAALQALLVTALGGLAMLAGLLLLSQIGGTSEFSLLKSQGATIRTHPLYVPMLLLILAGAFTKSAQFPFHFWLPGAMAAPTPVSAYLHSATMVKAGVYLLARLSPTLGGTDAWVITLAAVGAITMVVGGCIALYQTDLKLILAYSTVSALGTLVLLLGLGTAHAVTAAVVFLLAHAMYKGALFMVAGTVDHGTGTRDASQLAGLWRAMPATAAVAALSAVSLAGFGPVLSFIGKELLLESVLAAPSARVVLVPAVLLAGALFVTVAGIVSIRPFYGAARLTPKQPHGAPASLWLCPAVLAVLGPAMGVAPSLVEHTLVSPSALAVLGEQAGLHLALWHGFNPPLVLSIVSVIVGGVLYLSWSRLWSATPWMTVVLSWGPSRFYLLSLAGLGIFARALTRLLQNGYLRVYLLVTLVTAAGLAGYTLVSVGGLRGPVSWPDVPLYQAGLGGLMLLAALTATRARSRLAAVASLSVVGYGVALTYILFGAPDLAMTQFMVETLTMMLFVLVFYHLPILRTLSTRATRVRDAAIALGVGGFMTALVLVVTNDRAESRLASYFAEQSVPAGHGHNIVNVILVDFRAIDTLGEITVLAVAALGVFALLKLRPPKASIGPGTRPSQRQAQAGGARCDTVGETARASRIGG